MHNCLDAAFAPQYFPFPTCAVLCCVYLQYGPAGRSTTTDPECLACTTQTTGYSFSWQFQNDVINVSSISPVGANASTDCLAKYSQTFDGAW